jgi:hypothetical protein
MDLVYPMFVFKGMGMNVTNNVQEFSVGDVVKFRRQDLSEYQVECLIRLIISDNLTEPLVVMAVRNYEDPIVYGHHQEVTVETIGENKQVVTTTAFWFSKADYSWIMERYGQG